MAEKLRFTGKWPPPQYLMKYPNWEYALDEEGEDDQDETTLRPAEVQDHIAEYTAFTAADVVCADDNKLLALLEITGELGATAVDAFVDNENTWRITYHRPSRLWEAFIQNWLPKSERGPEVSMDDPTIFPLVVKSRLPRSPGDKPYHFVVYSDGTSNDLQ